ncbi:MAG TPA: 50S ribosomal protein L11 methyltransferase [Kofleriaceae bacterium]|nr:50S ribosomal protein L11 methyltransferase [Kofleriaceae bacterium]
MREFVSKKRARSPSPRAFSKTSLFEHETWRTLSREYRRSVPRWHFAMLNDEGRNRAFAGAIAQAGVEGGLVLDIGAGSGLLAMMAARAGARRVVSCEAVEPIARMARDIIAHNGLADRVTVVEAPSTSPLVAAALDQAATHLVTEIVDCGLVGEGLLPTLRHARDHLLTGDATIVPYAARIFYRLVESPAIYRNNFVSTAAGLDVGLFNMFSTRDHFPVRLETWPHRFLSLPQLARDFDFAADPLVPEVTECHVEVAAGGTAHGVILWFELDLHRGICVSNAPSGQPTHWMQAAYLFDHPIAVRAGDDLRLRIAHDDFSITFSPIQDPASEEPQS